MSAEDSLPFPHVANYPLNALISHAFGHVKTPMQYKDENRVSLEQEQLKRSLEVERPKLTPSERSSVEGNALSTSFHFYDSRPLTAYNSKPLSVKLVKKVHPADLDPATSRIDPHTSKELENFAQVLFEGLEKTLDTTKKHLDERFNSYENELEKIQKQIESLAYDSGVNDLNDTST